ncbi:helix-turn-helix domain-containing protein [Latilactobacillus sp. 5-91]|uniref:helix-turn-helix domain-containing protein n=1 Tax=Latilactobacillus sp. 5-91 TaxID=3410924 RepID=UPI003C717180
MNINYLLTEDDRLKYYLLQYLELNKSSYISVDLVCEFSGLSKFKVKKYLAQLQLDLQALKIEAQIIVHETSEITTQQLTPLITKKVRLSYLERSEIYALLLNALNQSVSVEAFAKAHFFSKSYAYSLKKQLTKLLKQYGIEYRNNELHGDELVVREFIYTIYYDFYNDLGRPFSSQLLEEIKQLKQQLLWRYQIDLSLVRTTKLDLFLGTLLQRLQQHHPLSATDFETEDYQPTDFTLNGLLAKLYNPDQLQYEIDYILTFLYAENMTEVFEGHRSLVKVQQINQGSQRIVETIMTELGLPQAIQTVLTHQIATVNIRLALFYAEISSFTSVQQVKFFEESYPTTSEVILRNLPEFAKQATINAQLTNTLFYNYLFAVIESVPDDLLNPPIHICVDFSSGKAYTHYIEQQILGFKNLNIVLERNITQKTQLFVSDFAQGSLKTAQIIWKNPPNADDWADFGDIIVQFKKDLMLHEKID